MRALIIGTGPSLRGQIGRIRESKLPKFGCNNVYQLFNDLEVLFSCNPEWWDFYWDDPQLQQHQCDKWTWHQPTADKYGLHWIEGIWMDGLSVDPDFISLGHSSGYQLLGIAYHYGVRDFVLCGYDLRYPPGYNGVEKKPGGDRHYFGEYPAPLQHWTKFNIGENGELNGLLDCYSTIDCDGLGIRIIQTNPESALDFFEVDPDAF